MEEAMTILHFDNNPKWINALEKMEIMKATTSDHMLNIIQKNNPHYRMLQSVQKTTTSADDCWGRHFDGERPPCVTYNLTRNDGNINLIR